VRWSPAASIAADNFSSSLSMLAGVKLGQARWIIAVGASGTSVSLES